MYHGFDFRKCPSDYHHPLLLRAKGNGYPSNAEESAGSINMVGYVDLTDALDKADEEVAAEREAAEVDASKKLCWLCCKPEQAVELRICSGCHTVTEL